ncbi:ABC transporter ATP-binding protein [Frankia sp. Hr75.2]|nr:ABC transporter ATP-binding protein [Frankia sp. Hr75.2]
MDRWSIMTGNAQAPCLTAPDGPDGAPSPVAIPTTAAPVAAVATALAADAIALPDQVGAVITDTAIPGAAIPGTAAGESGGQAGAAPAALSLEHASIAYGRVPVLHGVHGVLHPGRTLALIGPNGAGKSTLIKAVLGLVPVVDGLITVLGRPPGAARREVAYVPQADTLDPDFPISVGQVVLMGRYRGIGWIRRPGRADRAAAQAALEAVGLAHRARDRFGTLSGGQRQRVLLARAIAAQPRLLLLDEPFNGVDVVSQDALLAALSTLTAASTAVVVSTHDLALAQLISDEVCLLSGRQITFGPPAEALTAEPLRAAYGGAALEIDGRGVVVTRV